MNMNRAQTISLLLAVLMVWLYGGARVHAGNYMAHAGRAIIANPETRLDDLLCRLREVIKKGSAKASGEPEKGFQNLKELVDLKEQIIEENDRVQRYFTGLETLIKVKGLPRDVLERHSELVRQYDNKLSALLENLNAIESAGNDTNASPGKLTTSNKNLDLDSSITNTLTFLEQNTPHPRRANFDPHNLPVRSLKAGKAPSPRMTREEWLKGPSNEAAAESKPSSTQSPGGSRTDARTALASAPPTPADLAETIEVKFTPEIRQLADSLGRNPVKLFNWVRNNIEFIPTWGSIQGAQLCMENHAGNAFDTASLLIALFRYSGIPARYQIGTIEVPIERFKNWAGGFSNADAAASLFASGGVPSVVRRANQNGQIVTVRLEHAWIKAFVDYAPSGGSVQRTSDNWVEIDPSFKQHVFTQGLNIDAAIPSDLQGFINQLASTATIDPATGAITKIDRQALASFLTQQSNQRQSYVSTNFPNATSREIFGGSVVGVQTLALLAAAFPYHILARGSELSEVPDSLRHRVTIGLGANPQQPDSADQWNYTTTLPEIAGKNVLLLYAPASHADEQLLDAVLVAAAGILPLSIPSSVNLVAQLYIDNQLKATGQALSAGCPVVSQIKFSSPTVSLPAITNNTVVGEHFAIAFDVQAIPKSQIDTVEQSMRGLRDKVRQAAFSTITRQDAANLLLSSSITAWFNLIDKSNTFASTTAGVVTIRYPSVGMLVARERVTSLFGTAAAISPNGLNMDIDGDVVVSVSKDGDSTKAARVSHSQGALGSALEARIPELLLSVGSNTVTGISTMDALEMANDQGVPIFRITPANASTIIPMLQIDPADLADIQDAINAGLQVTVSRTTVTFNGQSMLGTIVEDPRTGSGAFLISGGTNGALSVILQETLFEFICARPDIYNSTAFAGFQWLPQMTDDIIDVGIEALEAVKTAIVPEGFPPGCYGYAFVAEYLGNHLVYEPGNPSSCGICAVAAHMGVTRFAREVTCR